MDPRQAAHTLEVIRTLMERTCQYRLLTAGASLAAGTLAILGAVAFFFLDAADPVFFGCVWGFVFASSLTGSIVGTLLRGREVGEHVWTRQLRMVLLALTPSLAAAAITCGCPACGCCATVRGRWPPRPTRRRASDG